MVRLWPGAGLGGGRWLGGQGKEMGPQRARCVQGAWGRSGFLSLDLTLTRVPGLNPREKGGSGIPADTQRVSFSRRLL